MYYSYIQYVEERFVVIDEDGVGPAFLISILNHGSHLKDAKFNISFSYVNPSDLQSLYPKLTSLKSSNRSYRWAYKTPQRDIILSDFEAPKHQIDGNKLYIFAIDEFSQDKGINPSEFKDKIKEFIDSDLESSSISNKNIKNEGAIEICSIGTTELYRLKKRTLGRFYKVALSMALDPAEFLQNYAQENKPLFDHYIQNRFFITDEKGIGPAFLISGHNKRQDGHNNFSISFSYVNRADLKSLYPKTNNLKFSDRYYVWAHKTPQGIILSNFDAYKQKIIGNKLYIFAIDELFQDKKTKAHEFAARAYQAIVKRDYENSEWQELQYKVQQILAPLDQQPLLNAASMGLPYKEIINGTFTFAEAAIWGLCCAYPIGTPLFAGALSLGHFIFNCCTAPTPIPINYNELIVQPIKDFINGKNLQRHLNSIENYLFDWEKDMIPKLNPQSGKLQAEELKNIRGFLEEHKKHIRDAIVTLANDADLPQEARYTEFMIGLMSAHIDIYQKELMVMRLKVENNDAPLWSEEDQLQVYQSLASTIYGNQIDTQGEHISIKDSYLLWLIQKNQDIVNKKQQNSSERDVFYARVASQKFMVDYLKNHLWKRLIPDFLPPLTPHVKPSIDLSANKENTALSIKIRYGLKFYNKAGFSKVGPESDIKTVNQRQIPVIQIENLTDVTRSADPGKGVFLKRTIQYENISKVTLLKTGLKVALERKEVIPFQEFEDKDLWQDFEDLFLKKSATIFIDPDKIEN